MKLDLGSGYIYLLENCVQTWFVFQENILVMEETLSDYEDYYYNYSESNCSQINSTSNFDENREDLIKDLDFWLKNVAILMIGIIGFLGK